METSTERRKSSSAHHHHHHHIDHSDRKPSVLLYLAALSALMGSICKGAVFGWSAPALEDMARLDSEPMVTDNDPQIKAWIGSCITLGALTGGLLSGPIIQYFGRKRTLVFYGIPFSIGWILIICAKNVLTIILGRVICGICCGFVSATIPTYVIEISTPGIRGFLGSSFQVFMVTGILMTFVFGSFMHWNHLAIIGLIPGVIMSIAMIFMPESPVWLINKYGKNPQALESLKRLRQSDSDIMVELKELEERAEKNSSSNNNKALITMEQIKRADLYKPFLISILIMFFQQASGITAFEFFTTEIFDEAGSSLSPNISTIIVGAAMVASTIVGSILSDRLGRKILLIVSGIGHVVSAGGMGLYYYKFSPQPIITNTTDSLELHGAEPHLVSSVGWLPIVCVVLFVVSFSVGFGPIGWMIFPEITPSYAIGYVSSLVSGVHWLTAFAVSYDFETLEHSVTKYGTYWLFASISFVSVIFCIIFVPETKGKTGAEISEMFLKGKRLSIVSIKSMQNNNNFVTKI